MTANPTVIAERAEALKELMNTGNLMSNMFFNLKQCSPDEFAKTGVGDRYIKDAGDLQQQWDTAKKRYREATQKEK